MTIQLGGPQWKLRADAQVGEGSTGRLYKATRIDSPNAQVVALKKCRASRTLTHTILNHERLVLQRLQTHPSIPKIFAYGRLNHFEYLAMDILGLALDEVHRLRRSLPAENILLIAEQMISALEHLHKNDLVHCDVKPGNILLHPTDPNRLYVVDFGLTRRISTDDNSYLDIPSYQIVGTLHYASLNMHYNIHPTPRDDIESLGYSLLRLSRGNLPWTYNARHGTTKTLHDQVLHKKKRYNGAELAPDGLACIGDMVDHARGLNFGQLPNYELLRSQIREARERGVIPETVSEWQVSLQSDHPIPYAVRIPDPPIFPFHPGQIVCCQVDARTTVEGYSARAGDPSFWRDPSLLSDDWHAPIRPAVILNVKLDKWTQAWTVQVACLGRGPVPDFVNAVPTTPLPSVDSVTPTPVWPISDSYCYVFPRVATFFCYPGEVKPVLCPWEFSEPDVDFLRHQLSDETLCRPLSASERDLYLYGLQLFVKITGLGPKVDHENTEGEPIEWGGTRAWFDEYEVLSRRRHDDERCGPKEKSHQDENSYSEVDFNRWRYSPGEITESITRGIDDDGEKFGGLPVIVDVEASIDVLLA